MVFIVDAVDRTRFPEAKKELDVSNIYICIFYIVKFGNLLYVLCII